MINIPTPKFVANHVAILPHRTSVPPIWKADNALINRDRQPGMEDMRTGRGTQVTIEMLSMIKSYAKLWAIRRRYSRKTPDCA